MALYLGPGALPSYKTPYEEDDPRICWCWYMAQQDWVSRHGGCEWSAIRPFTVIGAGAGLIVLHEDVLKCLFQAVLSNGLLVNWVHGVEFYKVAE